MLVSFIEELGIKKCDVEKHAVEVEYLP